LVENWYLCTIEKRCKNASRSQWERITWKLILQLRRLKNNHSQSIPIGHKWSTPQQFLKECHQLTIYSCLHHYWL
jgi:hypothetical protein